MKEFFSKRWVIITAAALAAVLVMALATIAALGGCERKVRLETGTRVMCTYQHVISDDVRVIEVPASRSGRYTVVTKTTTCEKHLAAEKAYAEAQRLIAAGDLKAAAEKLEQVVAIDAGFELAAGQLADIQAGKKPRTGGGGGGSSDTTETDDADDGREPVGPVTNLSGYVPDEIDGYQATKVISEPYTLTREYLPRSRPGVGSMVIVVEQYKDSKAAQAAMASKIKRNYPVGGGTSDVGGHQAYIGTDGRRFAIGAFNNTGVLVMVEVGTTGGDPKNVKDEVRAIVSALPQ